MCAPDYEPPWVAAVDECPAPSAPGCFRRPGQGPGRRDRVIADACPPPDTANRDQLDHSDDHQGAPADAQRMSAGLTSNSNLLGILRDNLTQLLRNNDKWGCVRVRLVLGKPRTTAHTVQLGKPHQTIEFEAGLQKDGLLLHPVIDLSELFDRQVVDRTL